MYNFQSFIEALQNAIVQSSEVINKRNEKILDDYFYKDETEIIIENEAYNKDLFEIFSNIKKLDIFKAFGKELHHQNKKGSSENKEALHGDNKEDYILENIIETALDRKKEDVFKFYTEEDYRLWGEYNSLATIYNNCSERKRKIEENKRGIDSLRKNQEEIEAKLSEISSEIKNKEAEAKEVSSKLKAANIKLNNLTNLLSKNISEEKKEELAQEEALLQEEARKYLEQEEILLASIEENKANEKSLTLDLRTKQEEIEGLEDKNSLLQEEIKQYKSKNSSIDASNEDYETLEKNSIAEANIYQQSIERKKQIHKSLLEEVRRLNKILKLQSKESNSKRDSKAKDGSEVNIHLQEIIKSNKRYIKKSIESLVPKTVRINYPSTFNFATPDNEQDYHLVNKPIEVPLISLIPISNYNIEKAKFKANFKFDVIDNEVKIDFSKDVKKADEEALNFGQIELTLSPQETPEGLKALIESYENFLKRQIV